MAEDGSALFDDHKKSAEDGSADHVVHCLHNAGLALHVALRASSVSVSAAAMADALDHIDAALRVIRAVAFSRAVGISMVPASVESTMRPTSLSPHPPRHDPDMRLGTMLDAAAPAARRLAQTDPPSPFGCAHP